MSASEVPEFTDAAKVTVTQNNAVREQTKFIPYRPQGSAHGHEANATIVPLEKVK